MVVKTVVWMAEYWVDELVVAMVASMVEQSDDEKAVMLVDS